MTRILVVEDEPTLRTVVSQVLERAGYLVQAVGTVREAVANRGPWNLLLLDRRLPNGDGLAVARTFPGVPVLTVSGQEDADLRKPFTLDELKSAVADRLASARL